MKVFASTVIDRHASEVWRVVRDFIGLTAWSNVVAEATMLDGAAADQVGGRRRLVLTDGAEFVETLTMLCDSTMRLGYDISLSPLPVENYLATMHVVPITVNDTSFVGWGAEFDCPDADAAAMRDVVGNQICTGGLSALKAHLETNR